MKPILCNTEMVRAILDGQKTVTRRVIKEPWYIEDEEESRLSGLAIHRGTQVTGGIPYPDRPYSPGDILYVREAWCRFYCGSCEGDVITGECLEDDGPDENEGCWRYRASHKIYGDATWKPAIHMPRAAARIFLRVTGVRVEQLQDITPAQIDVDGCKEWGYSVESGELTPSEPSFFKITWNNTIKPADRAFYGWEANPWVWVIKFERIRKEEAINIEYRKE